jgi:hypothetical protein
VVCADRFHAATQSQIYCQVCRKKPRIEGPPCACGCGEATAWERGKVGWSTFRPGHYARKHGIPNAKKLNPNWRPWNFGSDARKHFVCAQCGKNFRAHHNAKFCSDNCWKQSVHTEVRYYGREGHKYRMVRDENGVFRQEHRIVMEKKVGRRLKPSEVVHHIDEVTLNNEPENLWLFHCDGCHNGFHKGRRQLAYVYEDLHTEQYARHREYMLSYKTRDCITCGETFLRDNRQVRCDDCKAGKTVGPHCACGCGDNVGWGQAKRQWNTYMRGHHVRLHNPRSVGKS